MATELYLQVELLVAHLLLGDLYHLILMVLVRLLQQDLMDSRYRKQLSMLFQLLVSLPAERYLYIQIREHKQLLILEQRQLRLQDVLAAVELCPRIIMLPALH